MAYLYLPLLIALAMSAATVRYIVRDGRGPQRPPVSHLEDDRFVSPAAR